MTAYRSKLTELDIRRLIKAADDDDRAAAAHKLCRTMDAASLTAEERDAAEKILRLLAADAAEMVRRAMAVTLKGSQLIPRDVARRLAADVDSVALPIIENSPVFTDADLIEIVRAGSVVRQTAVAARPRVSRDVAETIAFEAAEPAVRMLASNDNADLSKTAMDAVLDRYGGSRDVATALAYRAVLPLDISERLIGLVSDRVRDHLMSRHAVAPETVIRLAGDARERATVDLLDHARSAEDMQAFCARLHARGALTASLLLRALATGAITFFEHGLAELAGTPHSRAWLMVHDAGPLGLRAIYDRAGLPPRLFAAFRAGVDTWRGLQAEGAPLDPETFQERMLQRFLTQRPQASRDDLAYLLERLDRAPNLGALENRTAA
ncbi:MAG: DUF2336 domain-containing protein [Brevundimonas sp.]